MLMKYLSTLNEPFIFEHSATGLYCFTQNKKTVTAKTTEELYRKIKPLRYEDLTMYQLSVLAGRLADTGMSAGYLPEAWNVIRDGNLASVLISKKVQEVISNFQAELREY